MPKFLVKTVSEVESDDSLEVASQVQSALGNLGHEIDAEDIEVEELDE